MSQSIPANLRQQVRKRANFRCEYCLVPEQFLATIFHVDHIRSLKHKGKTILDNLAYACPHCNQNKGSDIASFVDDAGETLARLFHPRKDFWEEHFETQNGKIFPKTQIGEATISILDFNQPDRVIFRAALAEKGLYPP